MDRVPGRTGRANSCEVMPHLWEDDAVPLSIIHHILGAAWGICQQPRLGGQPHIALSSVHLPCTSSMSRLQSGGQRSMEHLHKFRSIRYMHRK